MSFARPLADLIAQFEKLPGVGPKSAQRLAYHILRLHEDEVDRFADVMVLARKSMRLCSICCQVTDAEVCAICRSSERDASVICVVSEPRDLSAIERLHEFKGMYHVLHGALNPLEGVDPDKLQIRSLLARMEGDIKEVIVATNPTVEGDATALYLAKLLKPLSVKVTRLAHGMPFGGELDYADNATLLSALEYRREL